MRGFGDQAVAIKISAIKISDPLIADAAVDFPVRCRRNPSRAMRGFGDQAVAIKISDPLIGTVRLIAPPNLQPF
jgi:hypothetical protein